MLPVEYLEIFRPTPDGVCQHLQKQENGTCKCDIYETRPILCQIEAMARLAPLFGSSEVGFLAMNELACNALRKQNNDSDTKS